MPVAALGVAPRAVGKGINRTVARRVLRKGRAWEHAAETIATLNELNQGKGPVFSDRHHEPTAAQVASADLVREAWREMGPPPADMTSLGFAGVCRGALCPRSD